MEFYIGGEARSSSGFVGFGFDKISWRFSIVLLFDMSEECGVGEIPLAAGASKFPLCLFLGLDSLDLIVCTFLLAH